VVRFVDQHDLSGACLAHDGRDGVLRGGMFEQRHLAHDGGRMAQLAAPQDIDCGQRTVGIAEKGARRTQLLERAAVLQHQLIECRIAGCIAGLAESFGGERRRCRLGLLQAFHIGIRVRRLGSSSLDKQEGERGKEDGTDLHRKPFCSSWQNVSKQYNLAAGKVD